jgi:hypothetical protein
MNIFHRHNSIPPTASGIHTEDTPGDRPKFERVYTATLNGNIAIKVTIRYYSSASSLWKTGELTQKNGRWVLFDPDAIADKILDPVLVPLIQAMVDEVYALDRAYRNSVAMDEFVDEGGSTWRRAT